MKTIRNYNILLLIILAGSLSDCSTNPVFKDYLILVDSIKVTQNIVAGTPFQIEFFGTISSNGCAEFSHFTVGRNETNVIIEAWKKVETRPAICPTVIVALDGEILEYQLDIPGSYTLKIKQPDNSFLIENIVVQ